MKIRGAAILAGGILLAATLTALTHHRYRLSGDAEVLVRRGLIAASGYVPANLRAWCAGDPALHRSLHVEGGFPLLLAALSKIDFSLPFLVNVAAWPLLFASVYRWSWRGGGSPEAASWTLAGLALALWTHPALRAQFAQLSLPYREPCALLCAGIGWAVLAGAPGRARPLLAAGASLGLSVWFRLPLAAVIPVTGLSVLAMPGAWRDRVRRAAWWTAGVAIGLLPLLGQNVLEGRAPWILPSADALLLRGAAPAYDAGLHLGWHPANFPRLLPSYLSTWFAGPSLALHALALAAVALGWRRRRAAAPELWLYLCAWAETVFYGGYHRFIPRYLFASHWIVAVLAATAVAQALAFLTGRARTRAPWAPGAISALLGLGVLFAAVRAADASGRARAEGRAARAFHGWMRTGLPAGARVLTYDYALQLWLNLFGAPRDIQGWSWGQMPADRRLNPDVAAALAEGRPVFRLERIRADGRPQPSWSGDALRHLYAVLPDEARTPPPDTDSGRLLLSRLAPPDANPRCGVLPPAPAGAAWLAWVVRDSDAADAVQVRFAGPGAPAEAVPVRGGLHILVWNPDPDGGAAPRTWTSNGPLSAGTAEWFDPAQPFRVDFTDYETAPTHARWLDPVALKWIGYPHVSRDWGGYDSKNFRTRAGFRIGPRTTVRLPVRHGAAAASGGVLVLTYAAFGPDRETAKALTPTGYTANGAPLPFTTEDWSRRDNWPRLRVYFFRHRLPWPDAAVLMIESNASTDSPTSGLLLWWMDLRLGPVRHDDG